MILLWAPQTIPNQPTAKSAAKIIRESRVVCRLGDGVSRVSEKQGALKEGLRETQLKIPSLPFALCVTTDTLLVSLRLSFLFGKVKYNNPEATVTSQTVCEDQQLHREDI